METRPIHPFNGDVEVVGQALIKATVDQHTTERFQPLPKAIAQNSEPLCALRCISQRTLQRFSQSHHKRQRNAAASQSTLLAAWLVKTLPIPATQEPTPAYESCIRCSSALVLGGQPQGSALATRTLPRTTSADGAR